MDSTSAQALFALYAAENGAAQTAAQDLSGYQVSLLKLFEFLNDKIADGTVTLGSQLERASAQLEGTSYHRLVLTLVIQGSIWINFGITVLTGEYVLFMVYLVASAIQMGCNVDYAIVVASHYTEARASRPAWWPAWAGSWASGRSSRCFSCCSCCRSFCCWAIPSCAGPRCLRSAACR